ncbi:PREDICTED: splicing factor 3B subunit 4-like, partial [Nipponia nippon]|uniref:splicing factor 3B subunit 4-like n=1 Tax=Nipponia nippon TaxID=128390 RepID=UPI0005110612
SSDLQGLPAPPSDSPGTAQAAPPLPPPPRPPRSRLRGAGSRVPWGGGRQLGGDGYLEQQHGHQLEAAPLEALDDVPHQPPLHRVRLHQHQRLLLQLWGGCAGTEGPASPPGMGHRSPPAVGHGLRQQDPKLLLGHHGLLLGPSGQPPGTS